MRSTLMWIAKWFMRLPDKAVMVTVCSDFQWLNTENKVNHGKCVILLEYFICRWFKICLTEIFWNGPHFKNYNNYQLGRNLNVRFAQWQKEMWLLKWKKCNFTENSKNTFLILFHISVAKSYAKLPWNEHLSVISYKSWCSNQIKFLISKEITLIKVCIQGRVLLG